MGHVLKPRMSSVKQQKLLQVLYTPSAAKISPSSGHKLREGVTHTYIHIHALGMLTFCF